MAESSEPVHWAAAAALGAGIAELNAITQVAAAYVPTPHGFDALLVVIATVTMAGAFWRASRYRSNVLFSRLAVVASIACALGGAALFASFPTRAGPVVARVIPGVCLVTAGALAGAAHRELVRPALELSGARVVLRPPVWVGGGLLFGGWLLLSSRVAPWHGMLLAAMLLGAVAETAKAPLAYLHRPRLRHSRWSRVLGVGLTAACGLGVLVTLPISKPSEIASYPDPVVYVRGSLPRYVVTSGALGFELYVDHQLAVSSLDGRKQADTWLSPALALTSEPRRAAVIGRASALLVRRLLLDPRVQEVLVVTPDEAAVTLALGMPWLRQLSENALADPRVHIVYDEAVPWLGETRETFDIIVLDVGAPRDYRVGKAYTTYTFARLADRLTPEGTAVVPAASAVGTPDAHATIVAAARAVGLETVVHDAGLVTLGEWSIVLAAKNALALESAEVRGEFLTPESFRAALVETPDRMPPERAPSTLHRQNAVTAFVEADRE